MPGSAPELRLGSAVQRWGYCQGPACHRRGNLIQCALIEATFSSNNVAVYVDEEERRNRDRVIKLRDIEAVVKDNGELYWSLVDEFSGWASAVLGYAENC